MKEFESNRTINGSYGEVWLDDDYLGEIESGKAEGKGSIKLHHVRSNIAKKMSDAVKSGKTASCKIIMRLADPDALGEERVVLYVCKFSKATLMDWEGGKVTEESYDFSFEDWDFLDSIIA